MKTRYYKYTLKGQKSADEAQSALGDAASQGTIVRIDTGGGQTLVYVATEGSVESSSGRGKAAAAGGLKGEVVSEKDVTRIA